MKFGSVCSGIEAASLAWIPLGWEAAWLAEVDPYCAHLLHERYGSGRPRFMPDPAADGLRPKERQERRANLKAVSSLPEDSDGPPNYGDLTTWRSWNLEPRSVDVLVGGTPCQDLSVAGKRAGLAGARSGLALDFLDLLDHLRPRWVVWENVPGALSSNGGRDFGTFLGKMGKLGYGFAYRVLDAQYVRVESLPRAVPQRRRRVFVVGHLGDWRRAAAVLLERESMRGDPPPRREAGKGTASGSLRSSLGGSDVDHARAGHLVPEVAWCLQERDAKGADSDTKPGHLIPLLEVSKRCGERGDPRDGLGVGQDGDPMFTPQAGAQHGVCVEKPVAFNWQNGGGYGDAEDGLGITEDGTGPLSRSQVPAVAFKPGQSEAAGGPFVTEEFAPTLQAQSNGSTAVPAIAFAQNSRDEVRLQGGDGEVCGAISADEGMKQRTYIALASKSRSGDAVEVAHALRAEGFDASEDGTGRGTPLAPVNASAVRRLTPLECERLMGMPDGYTLVKYRSKPAADGPRYRALGNSIAKNQLEWLGRRIELVDAQ